MVDIDEKQVVSQKGDSLAFKIISKLFSMLQEKLTCSVTRPNYTASHLRDFLNKLISTTKTSQNIHIFKGMINK